MGSRLDGLLFAGCPADEEDDEQHHEDHGYDPYPYARFKNPANYGTGLERKDGEDEDGVEPTRF